MIHSNSMEKHFILIQKLWQLVYVQNRSKMSLLNYFFKLNDIFRKRLVPGRRFVLVPDEGSRGAGALYTAGLRDPVQGCHHHHHHQPEIMISQRSLY